MKLGIYDSGLGGMTVKREIDRVLPGLNTVYFADEQFLPLGEKTDAQIKTRLEQVCEYLFEQQDCALVLLACNTASVVGIRHLQQSWLKKKVYAQPRNILGISVPLVEYALMCLGSDQNLMICATTATIRSNHYQKAFEICGVRTSALALPELATAIEDGNAKEIERCLTQVAEKAAADDSKVIVLACTHYPIVLLQWKRFSPNLVIVDPSMAIANKLKTYLEKHMQYSISPGETIYITTGSERDFEQKVQSLFGRLIYTKQVTVAGA